MSINNINYIHGASVAKNGKPTHLYLAWKAMKSRCYNPNNVSFSRYGNRKIVVCQIWKKSFLAFQEWARSSGYKIGLTLDRIKNNKNYSPSNCQWLSHELNTAKRNVPCRKLSFADALDIRASDMSESNLADKYKISRIGIWRINNFKSYKKPYSELLQGTVLNVATPGAEP